LCFWTITATFPLGTSFSPAVFTVGWRFFQISHSKPVFFSGEKMPKGGSFLKMKYSAINSLFFWEIIA
jgi:hypothetical protein